MFGAPFGVILVCAVLVLYKLLRLQNATTIQQQQQPTFVLTFPPMQQPSKRRPSEAVCDTKSKRQCVVYNPCFPPTKHAPSVEEEREKLKEAHRLAEEKRPAEVASE